MLVKLDIFPSLGFSITGVPVDFPDVKVKPTIVEAEEPNSIISFELEEDEKDVEFKQRRDQFLQEIQSVLIEYIQSLLIQPGTFCIVSESVIELLLPEDHYLYVQ